MFLQTLLIARNSSLKDDDLSIHGGEAGSDSHPDHLHEGVRQARSTACEEYEISCRRQAGSRLLRPPSAIPEAGWVLGVDVYTAQEKRPELLLPFSK